MSASSAQPPPAGFGMPDEQRGTTILVSTSITTSIALVIVCMRLYVRSQIVRSVGKDDYWILAAVVLSVFGFAIIIPEVKFGAGRHIFYILRDHGPDTLITGLKLNFVTQFSYVFALAAVKVSIGLFLLRLVGTRSYKIIVWSLLVFLGLYTFGGSAALLASCRPFAANFDRTIPGASCYAPKTLRSLAFFNSACGIATDLIFAFLPVPLLWQLKINKRVKASLVCILSLGVFAASTSLVKLHYQTNFGKFGDFLWDSTELTIWSVTEVNVGIIAASVPSLKPLFKAVLGSTYGMDSQQYAQKSWHGYAHQSSGRNELSLNGRNRASRAEAFEMHNTKSSAGVSADRERNKLGMDNVSEESILPLQGHGYDDKPIGIMKTTSVFVKSDEINPPRRVEDRV